jgi:hypothetical protein
MIKGETSFKFSRLSWTSDLENECIQRRFLHIYYKSNSARPNFTIFKSGKKKLAEQVMKCAV